jgi:hypothetical protein
VEIASRGKSAFFGRNPKIGRSSVEDYTESLRRCSNIDLSVVLGVEVVDDFDLRVGIDVGSE